MNAYEVKSRSGVPRTVSVIYVAYRTPIELLRSSIESVADAAKAAGSEVEIIVADNGGLDRGALPEHAVVVGVGENLGFGKAVNSCVARASGEAVLLMNPDSRLDPAAFSKLFAALVQADSRRVLFGCLLINGQAPQIHAYNVWWTSTSLMLRKQALARQLDRWIAGARPVVVPRLCGAGLFARREHLLELGPFDDDFFLYGEDVDLSLRAHDLGYQTVLVPTALVRHDAGSSSEGSGGLVQRARTDAHFRLVSKNQPYFISILIRGEYVAITLLGVVLSMLRSAGASSRLERLREVRRWGLKSSVAPFQPSLAQPHARTRGGS